MLMSFNRKGKAMQIQPYLCFEGRTEEAIEFYKQALGARVEMLMRHKDNPEPPHAGMCAPESGDKVLHATLRIGETRFLASDGRATGKPDFHGFSLSLDARDEAHAREMFSALSDGGEVRMALGRTFFSPAFGMVADRFGVSWMVVVPQAQS
jgi:PhnB protein